MARYEVNPAAIEWIEQLIDSRRYVISSEWSDVQPDAETKNAYLERHTWEEYGCWHLGLTEGASEGTKSRYAFVVGDFQRVHRSGLMASRFRATQWDHKDIELASHTLIQRLDRTRGKA